MEVHYKTSIKIPAKSIAKTGGHKIDILWYVGSSYLGNDTCQSRERMLSLVKHHSGCDFYWREG